MEYVLRFREPHEVGFDEEKLRRLDAFLLKAICEKHFPGATLLIARRGGIVYYKAFGHSVTNPLEIEMRRDAIFDVASLTKVVVTTTLIMQLVERGCISLSDPLAEYLPEFRGHGREDVRIFHLLTHTSGLPSWAPLYLTCKSPEEVYDYVLKSVKLQYPPGKRIVYSDLGYILLGYLIERVLEEKLDKVASDMIFKPLGMRHTMYNPPPELRERIAATEYCKFRKRVIWGEVHDENAYAMGGVSGHAGLFTTAYDLARFAQMMLNEGVLEGTRILSPISVRTITQEKVFDGEERRALGWTMRIPGHYCSGGDLISEKAYGHTGFTGVSMWIDPPLELFVIFLTNCVHYGRENKAILKDRPRLHNMIIASVVE
ncbi:MAG: hypothetical protein DRJ51_04100 [Thermoprotei archaeon]|nr:MAG: hypothetical protein DRJ51_04100 [Thermoprotei archaeon]RLF03332.1 MAG: hypothetical protein DRJ59_00960 [Thermoprotei archaeon]